MPDSLHRVIASIYGAAFQQPLTGFQDFVLGELGRLVRFDAAVWATGMHATNNIHAVHLLNLPDDLMMRYKVEYVETDYLRARAIAEPGRTFRIEDVMSLDDYYALPAYTELGREVGIEHSMASAQTDPISGLSQLILLWRGDRDHPFSEDERRMTQTLVPHIVAAWQHRQVVAMGTLSAGIRDTQPDGSRAISVVDGSGMIYAVIGSFGQYLAQAVPGWIGPNLPDVVVEAIHGEASGMKLGRFSLSFSRAELRTIVAISPIASEGQLSAAELRTVKLFATGATYKGVAAELGVSANTVRNQLSAAYKKLGVQSKVGLVAAIK